MYSRRDSILKITGVVNRAKGVLTECHRFLFFEASSDSAALRSSAGRKPSALSVRREEDGRKHTLLLLRPHLIRITLLRALKLGAAQVVDMFLSLVSIV